MSGPRPRPLEERFWEKVHLAENGCHEWTGALTGPGYGQISVRRSKSALAHRVAWELFKGDIPEGLCIDHLCRNRKCVNVEHMELVTLGENNLRGESPPALNARKTHCPKGHEYADNNVIRDKRGYRRCRVCAREYERARIR